MNMLILGVLFLVALLAIGGAVWMAIGDRQGNGKAPAPAVAAPGQQAPAAPAPAPTGQAATAGRTAPARVPVPVEADELVAPTPASVTAHREQPFSALNGQFYELAAELRSLHREAQDIEQRLGVLTEMVNRIEREYGEVSLETE